MSTVTAVLAGVPGGDPRTASQLLPLVYEQLRKLAANKLPNEAPRQTLQTTALVGDYFGLAAAGQGFMATFTQPAPSNDISSIFARRIGP